MKAKSADKSRTKPSLAADIEAHLADLPTVQRNALGTLRRIIKSLVPEAVEGFSYGMPAFRYLGHPLVAYEALEGHCSFFPMSPKVQASFSKELETYKTSKGTILFLPEKPLPAGLLKKIVKARVREIKEKYG